MGSEIILTHPMVLQGDVSQVEAYFNPFGDSVNIGARFAPNIPQAQKSFWTHLIVLLGDVNQVKAHFNLFGDSFNLDTR
jgi:hypothetical protein